MPAEIRISAIHRITDDGTHCAFTDICRFRDAYFLTFRSCPDGHGISPNAEIRIMKSEDGTKWAEVHRFSVPDRDTRDPHFLLFHDELFVYTGTWDATPEGIERRELNDHIGFAAVSSDGTVWGEPQELETTRGYYIWRAASYEGKAYLCGRRKSGFISMPRKESEWAILESVLLAGDDGLKFSEAGLFTDNYGDETAFVFDDSGTITALARCRDSTQPASICRSEPPYETWERFQIDRNVGGPLIARWGDHLIAGGRYGAEDGPITMLYWMDDQKLVEAVSLPSGGDCSYPGFVEVDAQHGLVSYYSSHEGEGTPLYPASVYVAQIEIDS